MAKKTNGGGKGRPNELPEPVDPFDPHQWEAHGRLCQCMAALGMGSGPIRITTAAALWYYKRLWKFFLKQTQESTRRGWLDVRDYDATKSGTKGTKDQYQNHAAQVLDLSRTVGRLAAHHATMEGSFSISAAHIEKALDTVISHYESKYELRGQYCTGP